MKLMCTQENLKRAVGAVERAAGRQSALPILANVLLETEAGRLKLSATNLEIGIVARVGAKVEREGSLTVPVKVLSQFIGNLPETEVVTLEEVGQSLSVSCGGYQVKIKGLPASDFPIIPTRKSEKSIELPAQSFKTALSRLLPVAAVQETRLELTGVNFLFTENQLALASTDSFRLCEEILPLEKFVDETLLSEVSAVGSLILPASTLMEVSRAILPTQKNLTLALDENQVFFEMDGTEVFSRLILGKFPDYRQIMPTEFSFSAILEKAAFLRSLKIASVFAAGEIAVELCPEEGVVLVEAISSGVGEQRAEVPAKFLSGKGRLRAVFSPKSLLDGVGFADTPSIVFRGNTSATPVALSMTDGETPRPGFTYIMMPIQR